MEQQYPFSQEESKEIRTLAKAKFRGFRLSDLSPRERVFVQIIDLFLLSVGLERADVLHLPYEGGVCDQPSKTLKCWMECRGALLEFIADEQKKELAKMKMKSARRK